MRNIPLYFKLLVIVFYPLWFLFGFISFSRVKQDKNINKTLLSYKNGEPEGNKWLFVSKFWKFEDLKVYKKYKQTFNDFMLAIISKVLKELFIESGSKDCKELVLMIPYNIKPLPWKISDIEFNNIVPAAKFELPLVSEIKKETIELIKRAFFKWMSFYYIYACFII